MAVDVVALSAAITGVVSSQPASHKPNPATIIPFRSLSLQPVGFGRFPNIL
jgi:hypothetical protein